MSLRDDITKHMTAAMKAGEKAKLSTIRLLLSAVKYKEVDLRRQLTDEETIETVSTLIRQRQDSVEQFTKGNRLDLVEKETAEIAVLTGYLPQQLSLDELRGLIKKCATEIGAASMKDMGALMKAVKPLVAGKADGKTVADIVKETLSK